MRKLIFMGVRGEKFELIEVANVAKIGNGR